ncbi:OLC1v1039048C1 [Oldenlandia corymbosa var. corymbosa]|uniref:OLC1v1039048C1 n=1 Tax=Oldenlandia corymbosa var. corymbosa TaxID=529605 RepID=A0AAV1D3F5_OLDCO|nr:OLC1v1039048C1 [Oldenlandia corymbosa var. corymbosa]
MSSLEVKIIMESETRSSSRSSLFHAVFTICAILLSVIIMLGFISSSSLSSSLSFRSYNLLPGRVCDEIYVVREGETLHTISDKCGDPFIVEHNPHIHDPDDVFPGLVIKITPATTSSHSYMN